MAQLNDEIRKFIIDCLACYETPTRTAELVGEEFGVEITRMQVADYWPEGRKADNVAKRWRDRYWATRKNFLENTGDIPIANKSYRLRKLHEMAERAERSRNYPLASQLLEQAAKETGGQFTNHRTQELTGKDGGPIRTAHEELTEDQLKEELKRRGLPTSVFDS